MDGAVSARGTAAGPASDASEPDDRPVVAFLTQSAQLSGCELFLLRVTSAMTAVTPVVVLGEDGPLVQALTDADVECHVVPLPMSTRSHSLGGRVMSVGTVRKVAGTVDVARAVAQLCRRRGIRLVTTHSAKAHVYGGIAARMLGTRSVVHLHSVIGAEEGSRLDTALLRCVVRALPQAVVANSSTTASSIGRTRKRTFVVGCPVVIPTTVPPVPQPQVIAVIGRLAELKGQDVAVRAFAEARAGGLDPDVRLRIVGGALFQRDHAFARRLPALAAELGVLDAVDLVGHSADVAGEIARASVVVHASRRPEGFGQVVVEAMASGRAVVASDAGGPAEVITDGWDGVLVPAGDASSLARALCALVADDDRRGLLGRRARTTAERYALPVVVHDLERVLRAFVS